MNSKLFIYREIDEHRKIKTLGKLTKRFWPILLVSFDLLTHKNTIWQNKSTLFIDVVYFSPKKPSGVTEFHSTGKLEI